MKSLAENFEQIFVDAAMAEGRNFPSSAKELNDTAATFECTFVDIAFAETGNFTETACQFNLC